MHFKQAIKQVQHDNYSKAEKWLNRLQQSDSLETEEPQLAVISEIPSVSTASLVSPTELPLTNTELSVSNDDAKTGERREAESLSGGYPYHRLQVFSAKN